METQRTQRGHRGDLEDGLPCCFLCIRVVFSSALCRAVVNRRWLTPRKGETAEVLNPAKFQHGEHGDTGGQRGSKGGG
jgi:hypothetical protein